MNVAVQQDGRWVLGNPDGTCRACGAPYVVKHAGNGRAELWHPPTDCCHDAIMRDRRHRQLADADERYAEEADARARGWPKAERNAA